MGLNLTWKIFIKQKWIIHETNCQYFIIKWCCGKKTWSFIIIIMIIILKKKNYVEYGFSRGKKERKNNNNNINFLEYDWI